jgi:hypothetical protein
MTRGPGTSRKVWGRAMLGDYVQWYNLREQVLRKLRGSEAF